jgi:YVTN family beta-propeller protein
MQRIFRLRLFKSRWSPLLAGLSAFLTVVVLGVTMVPAISVPLQNLLVGDAGNGTAVLPTGQLITPTAAPGSTFAPLATGLRADGTADAQGGTTTALSPDGKTLLVLTSGYNPGFSTETGAAITYPLLDPGTGQLAGTTTSRAEWVFVYDISSGSLVKQQQVNVPNTYSGLVWAPDGQSFYVSGGIDDRVYSYRRNGDTFEPDAPFILLGHNSKQTDPLPAYDGGLLKDTPAALAATGAVTAGIDVSRDGKTLVAANLENDSISIVDTATRQVTKEVKFFTPGSTVATGEYPYWVQIVSAADGSAAKAYVSSQRDNEVMVYNFQSDSFARIAVGSQPNKMLLSPNQQLLYVANGNSDSVAVINTRVDQVVQTFSIARPGEKYKGSNPNSFALSPNGKRLYVTLGGENAVAVVALKGAAEEANEGGQDPTVLGRIPTGWYPNAVSVSPDGNQLFVTNAKGNSGPNPSASRTTAAGTARNTTFRGEYILALQKGGISVIPVPEKAELKALNQQVNRNNGFDNRKKNNGAIAALDGKIKHVLYIIKENRTYDQVLGDLPVGNGDPALTLFPRAITPNHHKLAEEYATFDNFYDSGAISGDGWGWSTFGRTTDYTEKSVHVLYGNGFSGFSYDYEGNNRFVLPALPNTAADPSQVTVRFTSLLDPTGSSSILPGTADISAPAGNSDLRPGARGGYLWDTALRAGKTVRAYGVAGDLSDFYYESAGQDPLVTPNSANPLYLPISRTPFQDGKLQGAPSKVSLLENTDLYFRGYDQKQPEVFSFEEWKRDVEAYKSEHGAMPNLMMMAFDHDHFGAFGSAVASLNTPELQMADNDYALGLVVEYLSKQPEWKETAIFVLEDDAQNGPDHVDAHRSLSYIISPYTKLGKVISTNYNTVSMIRTMEDVLGLDYIGITDANALPMSDAFSKKLKPGSTDAYQPIVPGNLCKEPVDPTLVPACNDANVTKTAAVNVRHHGNWWAQATKGFDFDHVDRVDTAGFNQVLWSGIKGDSVPYPADRSGLDLRRHRDRLLQPQNS